MMLINSLLSHATEAHWDEFTLEIERLNVAKAVERLMSSHTIEDLTSSILDFQANMVRVVYRRKNTPVVPENGEVQAVLNMIWRVSKVDEMPLELYGSPRIDPLTSPQLNGHPKVLAALEGRWWKLGFGSDDLRAEFRIGGMLALDCLVCYLLSLERNGNAILAETIRSCRSGEVCPADTGAE
jgi:engulfment/cell motility protein 1